MEMLVQLLKLQIEIEEEENCDAVIAALVNILRQTERRQRRWWIKPWLQRRQIFGQYETLFAELERESRGDFMNFIRMDRNLFAEVLQRVAPRITKKTRCRRPLEPGLKLVITLRFLATGNSYKSLGFSFRVAHNTICKFVPEVCSAIYEEYQAELFTVPSTPAEWRNIASNFSKKWNFHHCCGAIDGKHVHIKRPKQSGSLYFNYKGYCSIILLALVDADYKFIWANVGGNGSALASDAGIFNHTRLRPALEHGLLGFPDPDPLPGDDHDIPYFLVGDDAFPLRTWMMKPYSARGLTHKDRVFNYRLSRARRVVENAFGITAHRWRCLLIPMQLELLNASKVVHGTITLLNLLRTRYSQLQLTEVDHENTDGNIIPGAWRKTVQLTDPNTVGGQRITAEGKLLRNYLKDYYNSDLGRLPWQDNVV